VCRKFVNSEEYLCSECAGEIKPIYGKICTGCGSNVKNCECNRFIYHFDGVVAPFYNRDAAQKAFYDYKYRKHFRNAEFFVENMANVIKDNYDIEAIDCICCVPMDQRKKLSRGFNQSEELAKLLSRYLKIPLRNGFLKKAKSNKTQHELKLRDRFINVRGVYKAQSTTDAKTVLLIDDIKTTGATLDECARELKFAGVEKVLCATVLTSERILGYK
jgi:ComF family protein